MLLASQIDARHQGPDHRQTFVILVVRCLATWPGNLFHYLFLRLPDVLPVLPAWVLLHQRILLAAIDETPAARVGQKRILT